MRIALFAIVALLLTPQQDPNQPSTPPVRPAGNPILAEVSRKISSLVDSARAIGNWEAEAARSSAALEKVFQRSGWDSEADRFALELARAVDAIPPWEFERRGEVFFSTIARRYELNPGQQQLLQRLWFREVVQLIAQHSDEITGVAGEIFRARAAGEPFHADQIAELARMMEPVLMDARERAQRTAEELADRLDEKQRERLRTDLEAAERRFAGVSKSIERWKSGQWTPEEWGLEEDPIQTGRATPAGDPRSQAVLALREAHERVRSVEAALEHARAAGDADRIEALEQELLRGQEQVEAATEAARRTEPTARRPPAVEAPAAGPGQSVDDATRPVEPEPVVQPPPTPPREPPVRANPAPNDSWARFVEAFIRKYRLDSSQAQRAWLIYDETKTRRDGVLDRYKGRAASARGSTGGDDRPAAADDANADEQQTELARVFDQLRGRLERIPTRAQRKNAEPIELPNPLRPSPTTQRKAATEPRSGGTAPAPDSGEAVRSPRSDAGRPSPR